MVNAKEDQVERIEMSLDDIAKECYQQLIASGVDDSVARSFVCLRFHPECAWGLGKIDIADMETYAIVRPMDQTLNNVECVFAATLQGMPFSNLRGLMQIPDKKDLN